MISTDLIRRYPFFAGLEADEMQALARVGEEQTVETDHVFFREGDDLDSLYLIVEGAVGIFIEVPKAGQKHGVSGQLTGELETDDITVSTVGTGDVFGWSALIPPTQATAGAKAVTGCRVVRFDSKALCELFDLAPRFGYLMTQKAAQVMRDRLRDIRIESLVHYRE